MNVLLIDDDEDTVFLMGVLFRKSSVVDKYYIETKANEALIFLKNTDKAPDCIFVDLKMPEIDGFEFVEKYEQLMGKSHPHSYIYILSSSARQSDQQKATNFDSVKEFIVKPLTSKKLVQINESILLNTT